MGAKTCLLCHVQGDARRILANGPILDEATTTGLVAALYPETRFAAPRPADLSNTYVTDGTVVAGCFPGLRILATSDVAIEHPSELPAKFIAASGTTIVHAMHSVVDWCAFALLEDGVLRRSFSVSPDTGVIEDIGARLEFEIPFWNGAHPAIDPAEDEDTYPLPFHPLELGEAALREFFGFQLEGYLDPALLEPERVSMLHFSPEGKAPRAAHARAKAWWKFW